MKRSTNPFCTLPEAGDWMMAEGVTGRLAPKLLPVRKTASAVAAMAETARPPLPA